MFFLRVTNLLAHQPNAKNKDNKTIDLCAPNSKMREGMFANGIKAKKIHKPV